jgi:hypothetical protein
MWSCFSVLGMISFSLSLQVWQWMHCIVHSCFSWNCMFSIWNHWATRKFIFARSP